jgi:hypothetical protein
VSGPGLASAVRVGLLLAVILPALSGCDRGDALAVRNASSSPVLVEVNKRLYEAPPGAYAWALAPQQFEAITGDIRVLRLDCSVIEVFPTTRRGLVTIDRTGHPTLEPTDRGPGSNDKLSASTRCPG